MSCLASTCPESAPSVACGQCACDDSCAPGPGGFTPACHCKSWGHAIMLCVRMTEAWHRLQRACLPTWWQATSQLWGVWTPNRTACGIPVIGEQAIGICPLRAVGFHAATSLMTRSACLAGVLAWRSSSVQGPDRCWHSSKWWEGCELLPAAGADCRIADHPLKLVAADVHHTLRLPLVIPSRCVWSTATWDRSSWLSGMLTSSWTWIWDSAGQLLLPCCAAYTAPAASAAAQQPFIGPYNTTQTISVCGGRLSSMCSVCCTCTCRDSCLRPAKQIFW